MRQYVSIVGVCVIGLFAAGANGQATVYTLNTHANPYAAWDTDTGVLGPQAVRGEVNWEAPAFNVDDPLTGGEFSGASDFLVFQRPVVQGGLFVTDPFIGPDITMPPPDNRVFTKSLGFQTSDLSQPNWDDGSLDMLNIGALPRVAMGVWIVDEELRNMGSMMLTIDLLDAQGLPTSVPVVIPEGPGKSQSGPTSTNIQFVGVIVDPGYQIGSLHFTEPVDGDLIHYAGVVYEDIVPEPATIGMLALGSLGLAALRRRRRK